MTNIAACGLAVALGLGACSPTYTMTDDIDLSWDFVLTPTKFGDDLHSPYVRVLGSTSLDGSGGVSRRAG
jgi:hypothetical protein